MPWRDRRPRTLPIEEIFRGGGEQIDATRTAGSCVGLGMLDERSAEAGAAVRRGHHQRAQQRVTPAELHSNHAGRCMGRPAIKEVLHVSVRQVRDRKAGRIEQRDRGRFARMRADFGAHDHAARDALRLGRLASRAGAHEVPQAGGAAGATNFREIADQLVHNRKVRHIDELAAVARLRDQSGVIQVPKMERQRRRRHFQPCGDRAGVQPVGAGFDQHSIDAESVLMRERPERGDGLTCIHVRFHISIIVEL